MTPKNSGTDSQPAAVHTSSASQRSSEVGSGLGIFSRMYEALSNPFKRTISGNNIHESSIGTNTVIDQVEKYQAIKSARGPAHHMLPSPTEASSYRNRVYSNKFPLQTNQFIAQEERLTYD